MSVAYYVVLENGYQSEMGGKALAFEAKRLNAVSKTLGLKTLDDFVGTPSEELADLPEALTEDLGQLKEILEIARASGTRWHFGLDF